MHRSNYECYPNPDGTRGWVWNPITGSLGDCPNPNARKLANGRLRSRYLSNPNTAIKCQPEASIEEYERQRTDPFYPRFWPKRLYSREEYQLRNRRYPCGIFVCDMSDLFGIGVPESWTEQVFDFIRRSNQHRFYLLTKQLQNLPTWSPFPDNCWVGVTATSRSMFAEAAYRLDDIQAKVKYVSLEPLLQWERMMRSDLENFLGAFNWVIIGAQTKPYKPPKIEWVQEIVQACDKAGVAVFLKENLMVENDRALAAGLWNLERRQEMPA